MGEMANEMQEIHVHSNTQELMDYTAVPAGEIVVGHLWTGQSTASTVTCPKCGRIGVTSRGNSGRVIVHSGRIDGKTLVGIDYCTLGFDTKHRN
jgi:hypothetical protein